MNRHKKRPDKLAYIIKDLKKSNYFFSSVWWIANLGVVPLFLLSAFLLAPILPSLFLLLFFVILVFETILLLLYIKSNVNQLFEVEFLSKTMRFVKIFFQISVLVPICAHSISNISKLETKTILISRGQFYEIPIKLRKVRVSNNEVLGHKYKEKESLLVLKGKMRGYSEVKIWGTDKKKYNFKIYVFSKKKHLDLLSHAESLNGLGLKTQIQGPLIILSGELTNLSNYKLVQKIISRSKENIFVKATLSKKLQSEIIGEVYDLFFKQYIDEIKCQVQASFTIQCFYPQTRKPHKKTIQYLTKELGVVFLHYDANILTQNYRLKMKIISLEQLDGEEINFGLSKISGNLNDVFKTGALGLIKDNQILLKNSNVNVSTLAEPQSIVQINKDIELEVGSELPYQSSTKNYASKTIWKFAGLKIKLKLIQSGKKLIINYQTEFTRPESGGAIGGSKEKSSATITLKKGIELFQIGFRTKGTNTDHIPYLGRVPLLGKIFRSSSDYSTYKKISGVLYLEKI